MTARRSSICAENAENAEIIARALADIFCEEDKAEICAEMQSASRKCERTEFAGDGLPGRPASKPAGLPASRQQLAGRAGPDS